MMGKRVGCLVVVILIATAGDVLAECVDLNEASLERLTSIGSSAETGHRLPVTQKVILFAQYAN